MTALNLNPEDILETNEELRNKQKQVMIYAIENYPKINRTKLMKLIFFIDLYYYNYEKQEKTLLEDHYLRLPNGPVPEFGFKYTCPDNNVGDNVFTNQLNHEFTINKISNPEVSDYYHYEFKLNPGVSSDLSFFASGERDLINLALRTVMVRPTNYLSQISHRYNLWKEYVNGHSIDMESFALSDDEIEDLDRLLNTKIYLNSLNMEAKQKKAKEPGFPASLPIYVNANDENLKVI